MKKITCILCCLFLAACSGISDNEKKEAEEACVDFVSKNVDFSVDAEAFDIYKNKGNIVVEVGYKKKYGGDTYSMRLCVIDEERGYIFSPGVFNESEWSR